MEGRARFSLEQQVMVGRGHVDVARLSKFLTSRIVCFQRPGVVQEPRQATGGIRREMNNDEHCGGKVERQTPDDGEQAGQRTG